MLQAKLEAMDSILKSKDEVLRIKDEQLRQAQAREEFYQDELRTIRLLVAPTLKKEEKKRKLWFF